MRYLTPVHARTSRPTGAGGFLLVPLVLGLAAALPPAAQAQSAGDPDEIVVTVRKVQETLKEVPLAVTAFSGEDIESAGIDSLTDVANLTAGLQFFNPIGEFLPVPIIRGVAPTDIRGENNTGLFVDGVFVAGREGLNFSQLDIERIEVVKGPQSALYGRSAFSGAINYVTKRPSEVFEAKTEGTVGNEGKILGKASVSGPLLGEALRGRLAVLYDEWDGSYDNPVPGGDDVGGYRYRTFQGSLLFEPTDSLSALLTAYVSNDEIDDSATTALQANCEDDALFDPAYQDDDGNPVGVHFSNYCGKLPSLSGTDIPKIAEALGEDRDVLRTSLNIDWDVGVGTLSFLTGYTDTEQASLTDFSRDLGYATPFLYCAGDVALGVFCQDPGFADLSPSRFEAGVLNVENGTTTQEFSQEIRWTSSVGDAVRYSLGAYYYDETLEARNGYPLLRGDIPSDIALWCPCQDVGITQLAPFGSFIFGPSTVAEADRLEREDEINAWAGFSWVEWDLVEDLTARVELRYTDEEKTLTVLGGEVGNDSWDGWTGQFNLKYRVNDRWMVYGYVANARKSGGFDSDVVDLVNPNQDPGDPDDDTLEDVAVALAFDPEENVTYEVGAKGRTSDGRLGIDLALYHMDWDDIVVPQVFTSINGQLIAGGAIALNDNGGNATNQGWELTLDYDVTDDLVARATVAYQDVTWDNGRIASFQYFPSFQPDGDITGNQMLRQAEWTASGSLSYRHQVSGDWDVYGRGDVVWQDDWYVGNDNQGVVPSHTYVNLRLGLESGRYTVELWGDNLLEDDAPTGAFRDIYWTNTPDLAGANDPPTATLADFPVLRLTVNQPRLRTFGLTARVRFGGAAR